MNGNLWNRVLEHVRPKVNLRSYSTWLEPTRLHSVEGKTISVMVPNPLHATWIPNYTKLISEALLEITGEPWEVTFFSAEGDLREQSNQTTGLPAPVGVMEPARPSVDKNGQAYLDGVFNPCYTFGTFVEGTGNAFALAAARAVAEKPFRSHNPLYIFGKVGLGKTHLMHAIGNHLAASGRPLKIRYATTETFMNELITAIRTGKTMAFKDMYRSVDVLLVDDMQFLAKKERTQEEFFHTFNALYDMRKQIVMTCDCAPHEIPDLEERLRSTEQLLPFPGVREGGSRGGRVAVRRGPVHSQQGQVECPGAGRVPDPGPRPRLFQPEGGRHQPGQGLPSGHLLRRKAGHRCGGHPEAGLSALRSEDVRDQIQEQRQGRRVSPAGGDVPVQEADGSILQGYRGEVRPKASHDRDPRGSKGRSAPANGPGSGQVARQTRKRSEIDLDRCRRGGEQAGLWRPRGCLEEAQIPASRARLIHRPVLQVFEW